ncbi:MAG: DsrE family protein [Candidatus Nanohaloarchaea archaeon]
MKTVFHLSSSDKSKHGEVIGNIQNLIEDETVETEEIAVLMNAEGISMALEDSEAAEHIQDLPEKVKFYLCSNSVENMGGEEEDFIDRAELVSSGVGKLTELQDEGYSYIRP